MSSGVGRAWQAASDGWPSSLSPSSRPFASGGPGSDAMAAVWSLSPMCVDAYFDCLRFASGICSRAPDGYVVANDRGERVRFG